LDTSTTDSVSDFRVIARICSACRPYELDELRLSIVLSMQMPSKQFPNARTVNCAAIVPPGTFAAIDAGRPATTRNKRIYPEITLCREVSRRELPHPGRATKIG
jgi:hypothetical protein